MTAGRLLSDTHGIVRNTVSNNNSAGLRRCIRVTDPHARRQRSVNTQDRLNSFRHYQ
jgi:hypothetical protein